MTRELKCPPGVETATGTYDAGEGVNAGICCGCGMARDDHVPQPFEPNAVLIPKDAISDGTTPPRVDHEMCTLLYIDGNRNRGDLYTKEQWEKEQQPFAVLRNDHYYTHAEGNPICRANLALSDHELPHEWPRIQLLPDIWVLKVEETEYWAEEFRKEHKIKRIFGVYALNKRKVVHLCELTPSYELHRFESQWEDEGERPDDLDVAIRDEERHDEDMKYVHCCDVERQLAVEELRPHGGWLPKGPAGGYRWKDLEAVTEEDAIEELREATCNGEL